MDREAAASGSVAVGCTRWHRAHRGYSAYQNSLRRAVSGAVVAQPALARAKPLLRCLLQALRRIQAATSWTFVSCTPSESACRRRPWRAGNRRLRRFYHCLQSESPWLAARPVRRRSRSWRESCRPVGAQRAWKHEELRRAGAPTAVAPWAALSRAVSPCSSIPCASHGTPCRTR